MVEELDQKALPLADAPHPNGQPYQGHSPKLEREVSMTMEVRSLLSQVMLDMPGHVSGNSTPKRANPMVVLTPPPHKLRDLSGPVNTSSQVSAPDDAEMAEASLEEIPTAISPIAETPRPSSSTPHRCNQSLREGQQGPRGTAGS